SAASAPSRLIIGCTGDPPCRAISSTVSLPPPSTRQPISSEGITEEERTKLKEALVTYHLAESDPDNDRKTVYVPVWLEDAVAHGHYDGYYIASEDTSQDAHYAAYATANHAFAERIKNVWRLGKL
ncbi:hypothetical protein B0H16DRAFT_1265591, partial [Mycena metata]